MRLLVFAITLLGLFAIELLEPVQTWVIQPFTGLIAQASAALLQSFDSAVQAQGIVLSNPTTGAAVSIQPGCNGVEAMIVVMAAIASPIIAGGFMTMKVKHSQHEERQKQAKHQP